MARKIGRNAVVALVAACTAMTSTPPAPAAAAPAGTGFGFGFATRVLVERTGGFAGGHDVFVVDRSTAGGQRARRLAESHRFISLRSSYRPKNSCCDRYFYHVAVSYRGGYRKTVSTVQGADAPRILFDLISEVERVGTRSSAVAPAA